MAKRVRLTPDEITSKWGRRLKQAAPDIVAGVERVTESPMEKAAGKADKMKQNLIKSLDDGTWAKRLRAVPLEDWKKKTAQKVQERLAGGVDAATEKHRVFSSWLVDRQNTILADVDKMPDLTLEDSINRMTAMVRGMAAKPFKRAT